MTSSHSRSRRRRLARAAILAVPAAVGTVGALATLARRDRRAIAADPVRPRLQAPTGGESRTVTAPDGTRLHVELFGPADAQPVVLLHGWTCALRFWAFQVPVLAERYRVIAVDLRGHGRSEAGHTRDHGVETLAADLDAVLEATTGRGSRPVLVGHSMGAMTIVAWSGRHRGDVARRIAGAALLNTGVSGLADAVTVFPGPARLRAAVYAASSRSALPTGPASPLTFRAVRRMALSRHASSARVAFCEEMILATKAPVRAGFGRGFQALDLDDALEHLDVPTLVVAAELDRLTPPVHARRMAEHLPRVQRLLVVPGSGHMAPVEVPDTVNAALLELLEAVSD